MSKPDIFATPVRSAKVIASTNNIPSTYSTGAGSLVLSDVAYADRLMILNETTSRICVHVNSDDATAAPSNGDGDLYVLASGTSAFDEIAVRKCVYIRSDSGSAITTGTVTVMAW